MLQTETHEQAVAGEAERRGAFRVSNPVLSVEIGGRKFSTENWSLNGLLLNGIPADTEEDQPVNGIFGPLGSAEMCRFDGHVVRLCQDSMTTAIELDEKSADVAALLPLWVLKYGGR